MVRRLIILVFTLSVIGNALEAAARVNNDDCGGCCRPAIDQPAVSLSIGCCYSECGEPGETQPTSPKGVPGIERIYKIDAPIAATVVAPLAGRYPTVLDSPGRSIIQSTHIYLRTGTLLI
jgi:hypothetical protein